MPLLELSDLFFSPRVVAFGRAMLVRNVARWVRRDEFIFDRPREHPTDRFHAVVRRFWVVGLSVAQNANRFAGHSRERKIRECFLRSRSHGLATRSLKNSPARPLRPRIE